MYSKLSFFFLLVGLTNQIIAAPDLENEITDTFFFLNYSTSTEETTNSNDNFEANILTTLQKCLKHNNSSIFDIDLVQSIKEQISKPFNHVDDSLLSDETKKQIETIFDSIIYALNNTDDSKISESINQATEHIVYIVLSGKRSELKQIIRMIAESSQELTEVLTNQNEDISELIQSMNYKIVTLTMLKEDPSMSIYLLNLLLEIQRVIDHCEARNAVNEVVKNLRLTLEQTKQDIMQSQISNDTEVVQPLIRTIDYLADEISYIFGMNISDQDKFRAVRCRTDDYVMGMFMQIFMIKFRSEIDF